MLSKNWGAQSYFFHILSGTKSGKKMFLYGYESVKLQKKKKKKNIMRNRPSTTQTLSMFVKVLVYI